MDITKKAKEVSEKGGPYSTNKQNYEFMFLEGYNAACEWFPMDSANKQEEQYILIIDENNVVNVCDWRDPESRDDDFEEYNPCWCIKNGWMSHIGCYHTVDNPVAWMPLPKYTHKP